MTRRTVKMGLTALALAATLGGWAVLARDDSQPAPAARKPVLQTLDLASIPTVARPPAIGEPGPGGIQVAPLPALPTIPMVNIPAPAPRPFARTRSSR